MKVPQEIVQIIKRIKFTPVPVTKESNLYQDLGFDSLTFVFLLLKIEEFYSIEFELLEMSQCLQVGNLIAMVERKIQEACHD